jgi:hypothetical protein
MKNKKLRNKRRTKKYINKIIIENIKQKKIEKKINFFKV